MSSSTAVSPLQKALHALDYADIGDPIGYPAKYKALHSHPVAAAADTGERASTAPRWIALGVGAVLPAPALQYAVEVCQRMQAHLLLITPDAAHLRTQLLPYSALLNHVICEAEEITHPSRQQVSQFLKKRTDIVFAVSSGQDDPLHGLLSEVSPVPIATVDPVSNQVVEQPAKKSAGLPPQKKASRASAILFGTLSLILYVLLLSNGDLFVTWAQATKHDHKSFFIIPVIVAFIFSYVHGSFTGYFWESLGLRAAAPHRKK